MTSGTPWPLTDLMARSTSLSPNLWVVILSSGKRRDASCASASSQALGILVALAGVLALTEARAQPVGVEAIANYAGADRQRLLEAGARREGSILLYTTGTQTRPLRTVSS